MWGVNNLWSYLDAHTDYSIVFCDNLLNATVNYGIKTDTKNELLSL